MRYPPIRLIRFCPVSIPLLAAACLFFTRSTPLSAQTLNPPYLKSFPSVERVLQEVSAPDPKQAALLQMQALWELGETVKELAGPREFGRDANGLTPDEIRVTGAYRVGLNHFMQDCDQKWPGPYGDRKRFSANINTYPRNDPRFGRDTQIFQKFLAPDVHALYVQALANDQTRHNAFVQKQQSDFERAKAAEQAANTQQQGPSKTQAALRACVETGRSEADCLGSAVNQQSSDMFGSVMSAVTGQPAQNKTPGLRMTGVYRAGSTQLTFLTNSVLFACGPGEPAPVPYTISQNGNQLLVTIPHSPKPYVFTYQPGNKLAVGPIDYNARVVVGKKTGYCVYGDNTSAPIEENIYENRVVHCGSTVLSATGPTLKGADIVENPGAVFGTMISMMGPSQQPSPPGLRLRGTYAASNGPLQIEFSADAAAISCGPVHVGESYSIDSRNGQMVVLFQNSAGPFSLTLQPNGSLSASGAVPLTGRVIVGQDASGPVSAPRSVSCPLSPLTPR